MHRESEPIGLLFKKSIGLGLKVAWVA